MGYNSGFKGLNTLVELCAPLVVEKFLIS